MTTDEKIKWCRDRKKEIDRMLDMNKAMALRIELLESVVSLVKHWCELNRREDSVIYKPVCEVLKGGK